MNEFTREELENILNGNVTIYPYTYCNLVNKIQSMIDQPENVLFDMLPRLPCHNLKHTLTLIPIPNKERTYQLICTICEKMLQESQDTKEEA